MSQAAFLRKFLSWVITIGALGFLYAGEALAVCCKNPSTGQCKCVLGTSCSLAGSGFTSTVSSCSLSGGSLNLNGSRISCVSGQSVGFISADRATKTWTESGDNIVCELQDDSGLNGQAPGTFDLALEYKNVNVQCNDTTGVLTYSAVCGVTPDLQVKGTLTYAGAPGDLPFWVSNMCTDSKGQIVSPCPTPQRLVLGGFELTNKGIPDPKKCLTDFPDQSTAGGLQAGHVLLYTEQFVPGSNCSIRTAAGDAKRRSCHDHTFYNLNYDEAKGTGATNPPCDPEGKVSYRAGILATDAADIKAAPLYDNQWTPGPTLNLTCNNQGTVPTTIQNDTNFAASAFPFDTVKNPIIAYVKGHPELVSQATGFTVVLDASGNATGARVTFADCNQPGVGGTGLDEVICQYVTPSQQTVDLTVQGIRSDGGLGFIGDALGIKINNATNCPL